MFHFFLLHLKELILHLYWPWHYMWAKDHREQLRFRPCLQPVYTRFLCFPLDVQGM